jgi:hypothetical protein
MRLGLNEMPCVYTKSGVLFTLIAPGGFRILSAIDQTTSQLGLDLIITSGTDGVHSGPDDPHHRGEAYDVRSHEFTPDEKDKILAQIMTILEWNYFYGFLEDPGTDNEHWHIQVKKGTVYPPPFGNTISGGGS